MAGDGTSRATVIKIARAIIILKPAFLAPRSTGAWSLPSPGGGGRRRLDVEEVEEEKVERRGLGWCTLGIVLRVCYRGGFGVGGQRGLPGAREGPGEKGWVIYFPPRGIIYREDFRESTQRAPR